MERGKRNEEDRMEDRSTKVVLKLIRVGHHEFHVNSCVADGQRCAMHGVVIALWRTSSSSRIASLAFLPVSVSGCQEFAAASSAVRVVTLDEQRPTHSRVTTSARTMNSATDGNVAPCCDGWDVSVLHVTSTVA